MDTTLLVMAAGMGSRFGGLKQITPVGSNGASILDYSVYDAQKAGFNKVVFIIKKEIEKDFRETVGKRIENKIDVAYAFQELDKLPAGFSVPEGRKKPWGTGHAVLCARSEVTTPFAVINADDFYGQSSYALLHDHLVNDPEMCMVGFRLGNTLTENGTVSRGVCEIENGYLQSVTEHFTLDKNSGVPLDKIVSMNMWGLSPKVFDALESGFIEFMQNLDNPEKGEFFLPAVIDGLIKTKGEKVRVLSTEERWFGMTYKEDAAAVSAAIKSLEERGYYDGM